MDTENVPEPSGTSPPGAANGVSVTVRAPNDTLAPLPLAIDALDAAVELYQALDPDTPGCCIPNELLSAGLATIAGKLTSIIVSYVDLEQAKIDLAALKG